mgnify:CR=1 FL=1
MLIKIGDCFVDPEEIALIRGDDPDYHPETGSQMFIQLRRGAGIWITATLDEAEAALIDAGVIENPYPEAEDEAPTLNEEETAELRAFYDQDFGYIARDADGRVYAYKEQPVQDDGYFFAPGSTQPVQVKSAYTFLDIGEAMSIPWLLLG